MAINFTSPLAHTPASIFSALAQHSYTPAAPPPAGFTHQSVQVTGTYGLINPQVWRDEAGNVVMPLPLAQASAA
jgi:hypothetical protein